MRIKMGSNGRMTIPVKLREALGVKAGDEIVLLVEGGTIRMIPHNTAIRLAQDTVRRYVPEGTSLVDDLLRDRRGEVKRVGRSLHIGRRRGTADRPHTKI